MALLFIDGFDHYSTNADLAKKWNSVSGTYPTVATSSGRRGGGALQCQSTATYYVQKTFSAKSTIIIGMAVKFGATANDFLGLYEGGTTTRHLTLYYDGANVKLYRGTSAGTLLATSSNAMISGAWTYVEIKATIHDTTGAYELRFNGSSDAAMTASSVDTRNGGTSGVIDTVRLVVALSTSAYFDDIYICDNSGASNNSFLGDCRIDTLLPIGDGNYTQFTPSTGTAHYATVDETTPNTTDYNSGANSGDRDSYTFPDLTSLTSQTVYGVQINAAALKSDSGARSLGTMSRSGSTNKDGAGGALSTSQTFISELQETDPANNAWTESNVNAAEFGVKVTA